MSSARGGLRMIYGSSWLELSEAWIPAPPDFSNFIVVPENRAAYEAALAVAGKVRVRPNPLILQGDAGSGKTHLLLAIARKSRAEKPRRRIAYWPILTFIDVLIDALRESRMERF